MPSDLSNSDQKQLSVPARQIYDGLVDLLDDGESSPSRWALRIEAHMPEDVHDPSHELSRWMTFRVTDREERRWTLEGTSGPYPEQTSLRVGAIPDYGDVPHELAVTYHAEEYPDTTSYVRTVLDRLQQWMTGQFEVALIRHDRRVLAWELLAPDGTLATRLNRHPVAAWHRWVGSPTTRVVVPG